MRSLFPVSTRDVREYSSPVLAYLGDALLEMYIRAYLVEDGIRPVRELHQAAVGLVSAANQAQAAERLETILTLEEREVLRRGRNAKDNGGRNTDAREHALSTGLEAVFGYLFIKGEEERLEQLLPLFVELSLNKPDKCGEKEVTGHDN
ncbi:MAG: Mini-ribonuclease 3 [Methylocystaceae bacterium]